MIGISTEHRWKQTLPGLQAPDHSWGVGAEFYRGEWCSSVNIKEFNDV